MIKLHDNETVILLLHKHWFVMIRAALTLVAMLALLIFILAVLPVITADFDPHLVSPLTGLGTTAYLMVMLIFTFFSWMDYYLDVWIVTEKRIMDIEQRGLFSREVAEIPMANVQDVTIEVLGIIETILKFGTIKIQTAGEREFTIDDVPRLAQVKDIILTYAHQQFDVVQKSGIRKHES